ncbi:hypothetical protein CSUI_001299, partial [Cystoisospora suis]
MTTKRDALSSSSSSPLLVGSRESESHHLQFSSSSLHLHQIEGEEEEEQEQSEEKEEKKKPSEEEEERKVDLSLLQRSTQYISSSFLSDSIFLLSLSSSYSRFFSASQQTLAISQTGVVSLRQEDQERREQDQGGDKRKNEEDIQRVDQRRRPRQDKNENEGDVSSSRTETKRESLSSPTLDKTERKKESRARSSSILSTIGEEEEDQGKECVSLKSAKRLGERRERARQILDESCTSQSSTEPDRRSSHLLHSREALLSHSPAASSSSLLSSSLFLSSRSCVGGGEEEEEKEKEEEQAISTPLRHLEREFQRHRRLCEIEDMKREDKQREDRKWQGSWEKREEEEKMRERRNEKEEEGQRDSGSRDEELRNLYDRLFIAERHRDWVVMHLNSLLGELLIYPFSFSSSVFSFSSSFSSSSSSSRDVPSPPLTLCEHEGELSSFSSLFPLSWAFSTFLDTSHGGDEEVEDHEIRREKEKRESEERQDDYHNMKSDLALYRRGELSSSSLQWDTHQLLKRESKKNKKSFSPFSMSDMKRREEEERKEPFYLNSRRNKSLQEALWRSLHLPSPSHPSSLRLPSNVDVQKREKEEEKETTLLRSAAPKLRWDETPAVPPPSRFTSTSSQTKKIIPREEEDERLKSFLFFLKDEENVEEEKERPVDGGEEEREQRGPEKEKKEDGVYVHLKSLCMRGRHQATQTEEGEVSLDQQLTHEEKKKKEKDFTSIKLEKSHLSPRWEALPERGSTCDQEKQTDVDLLVFVKKVMGESQGEEEEVGRINEEEKERKKRWKKVDERGVQATPGVKDSEVQTVRQEEKRKKEGEQERRTIAVPLTEGEGESVEMIERREGSSSLQREKSTSLLRIRHVRIQCNRLGHLLFDRKQKRSRGEEEDEEEGRSWGVGMRSPSLSKRGSGSRRRHFVSLATQTEASSLKKTGRSRRRKTIASLSKGEKEEEEQQDNEEEDEEEEQGESNSSTASGEEDSVEEEEEEEGSEAVDEKDEEDEEIEEEEEMKKRDNTPKGLVGGEDPMKNGEYDKLKLPSSRETGDRSEQKLLSSSSCAFRRIDEAQREGEEEEEEGDDETRRTEDSRRRRRPGSSSSLGRREDLKKEQKVHRHKEKPDGGVGEEGRSLKTVARNHHEVYIHRKDEAGSSFGGVSFLEKKKKGIRLKHEKSEKKNLERDSLSSIQEKRKKKNTGVQNVSTGSLHSLPSSPSSSHAFLSQKDSGSFPSGGVHTPQEVKEEAREGERKTLKEKKRRDRDDTPNVRFSTEDQDKERIKQKKKKKETREEEEDGDADESRRSSSRRRERDGLGEQEGMSLKRHLRERRSERTGEEGEEKDSVSYCRHCKERIQFEKKKKRRRRRRSLSSSFSSSLSSSDTPHQEGIRTPTSSSSAFLPSSSASCSSRYPSSSPSYSHPAILSHTPSSQKRTSRDLPLHPSPRTREARRGRSRRASRSCSSSRSRRRSHSGTTERGRGRSLSRSHRYTKDSLTSSPLVSSSSSSSLPLQNPDAAVETLVDLLKEVDGVRDPSVPPPPPRSCLPSSCRYRRPSRREEQRRGYSHLQTSPPRASLHRRSRDPRASHYEKRSSEDEHVEERRGTSTFSLLSSSSSMTATSLHSSSLVSSPCSSSSSSLTRDLVKRRRRRDREFSSRHYLPASAGEKKKKREKEEETRGMKRGRERQRRMRSLVVEIGEMRCQREDSREREAKIRGGKRRDLLSSSSEASLVERRDYSVSPFSSPRDERKRGRGRKEEEDFENEKGERQMKMTFDEWLVFYLSSLTKTPEAPVLSSSSFSFSKREDRRCRSAIMRRFEDREGLEGLFSIAADRRRREEEEDGDKEKEEKKTHSAVCRSQSEANFDKVKKGSRLLSWLDWVENEEEEELLYLMFLLLYRKEMKKRKEGETRSTDVFPYATFIERLSAFLLDRERRRKGETTAQNRRHAEIVGDATLDRLVMDLLTSRREEKQKKDEDEEKKEATREEEEKKQEETTKKKRSYGDGVNLKERRKDESSFSGVCTPGRRRNNGREEKEGGDLSSLLVEGGKESEELRAMKDQLQELRELILQEREERRLSDQMDCRSKANHKKNEEEREKEEEKDLEKEEDQLEGFSPFQRGANARQKSHEVGKTVHTSMKGEMKVHEERREEQERERHGEEEKRERGRMASFLQEKVRRQERDLLLLKEKIHSQEGQIEKNKKERFYSYCISTYLEKVHEDILLLSSCFHETFLKEKERERETLEKKSQGDRRGELRRWIVQTLLSVADDDHKKSRSDRDKAEGEGWSSFIHLDSREKKEEGERELLNEKGKTRRGEIMKRLREIEELQGEQEKGQNKKERNREEDLQEEDKEVDEYCLAFSRLHAIKEEVEKIHEKEKEREILYQTLQRDFDETSQKLK